jgi:hypothetical protein
MLNGKLCWPDNETPSKAICRTCVEALQSRHDLTQKNYHDQGNSWVENQSILQLISREAATTAVSIHESWADSCEHKFPQLTEEYLESLGVRS